MITNPLFQNSEHALESYHPCGSFSVYAISLKRKQHIFFPLKYVEVIPKKREVLLHYFNMKKTLAKSHNFLVEFCGENTLVERTPLSTKKV